MAELLTSNQHIRSGVLYPESNYSRVVGALAIVKAPPAPGFGYTMSLGNRIWLKTVRVWFLPVWPGGGDWIDFWVRFGQGKPATHAAVANWEDILPIHWLGAGPLGYRELGTGRVFEWTMNRLFVAEAIRFGIEFTTAGLITYEEMYATFEIAEG